MSGEERHYLYRDKKGGEAWLFVSAEQVLVSMPAAPPVEPGPCKPPHQVRISLARLKALVEEVEEIKAIDEKMATILISPEEIEAAGVNDGWTQEQFEAWGIPWPPPPTWQRQLKANWERAQTEEKS